LRSLRWPLKCNSEQVKEKDGLLIGAVMYGVVNAAIYWATMADVCRADMTNGRG